MLQPRCASSASLLSVDLTRHQLRTSSYRPGSCFVPQGLSCVPCPRGGDSVVVAANSSLNAGLNLGLSLKGKADTSLNSAGDSRVGTSLDAKTSLDLATNLKLAASSTTNNSLSSGNPVVDSAHVGGTTDLRTNIKAAVGIDTNLKTKTDVHSGSTVVVGSKADLNLSAAAKIDSKAQLSVDANASLAATATLNSVKVAVAANAAATGVAVVSV